MLGARLGRQLIGNDVWWMHGLLIGRNAWRVAGLILLMVSPSLGEPPLQSRLVIVENAILKTIETTTVPAEATGVLVSVAVAEGSVVQQGAELAKIRDDIVRLQVDRARLQRESALRKQKNDINLQLALKSAAVSENELKRAENANRVVSNTYPQNEIDRLRLVLDRARLEIERAKHERELQDIEVEVVENEHRQAQDLLARHRIVAPNSGMIVQLEKKAGEWVEPGTKIVQIVRIDRLRIEGFVGAADATDDLAGATAKAEIAAGTKNVPSTGKVVFVSPDSNPVNGLVRVFIEIENPQGKLRPGLKVNAVIMVPIE